MLSLCLLPVLTMTFGRPPAPPGQSLVEVVYCLSRGRWLKPCPPTAEV